MARYHDDGAVAWFATIKRIQTAGLVGPASDDGLHVRAVLVTLVD
jgi:hypothetical protein